MYDLVIIGGGIAGLYCGYKLLKNSSNNFIILEKNIKIHTDRKIGAGRLESTKFRLSNGMDEWVATGGGIGVEDSKLLLELLSEFNISPYWFDSKKKTYDPNDEQWFADKVKLLKKNCQEMNGMTFKVYSQQYLTPGEYERFMIISGYRDFEDSDSFHALTYYGIEDNTKECKAFITNWGVLVERLYEILKDHIFFSKDVSNITRTGYEASSQAGSQASSQANSETSIYQINCEDRTNYQTKKIVCATDVTGLIKIFGEDSIYQTIKGQTDIRVYAEIKSENLNLLMRDAQNIKTNNILQQIIKVNGDIYIAAYCDNRGADIMLDYNENNPINRFILEQLINKTLESYSVAGDAKVTAILSCYHKIAVHLFSPINQPTKEYINHITKPAKNILVVGEVVHPMHGWVESALESTVNLLDFINT